MAGLDSDRREALLAEIKRSQPEQWRRAERPYRKALDEFAKTGYILNVDTFFNGLCTVAMPIGGPEENKLYVIYCSALTSVLNTDKLRREAGLALREVARKLAPVIERNVARPRLSASRKSNI